MTNFICPIDNPRITSVYGMRLHPVLKVKRLHAGIDLVSTKEKNPPVHSTCDGTVRIVKDSGSSGYGKHVIITHNIKGVKYETVYAHLKSYSVKVGQKVKQGDIIGILGNSGLGTGAHLHYEIHKGKYTYANGTYPTSFNPMDVTNLKNTPSTLKATSSTPPNNSKGDENELKFTSSTLKSTLEKSVVDKNNRKQIIERAIKELGYNTEWRNKKVEDGDILSMALSLAIKDSKK